MASQDAPRRTADSAGSRHSLRLINTIDERRCDMKRTGSLAALLAAAACSAAPDDQVRQAIQSPANAEAADDGTYLARIDPLGGRWLVQRIDGNVLTTHDAWVDFTGGGFLNHGAGCGGGHLAFYRLEGEQITVIRREPVRIGRCGAAASDNRHRAAASETLLSAFLDRLVTWKRPDDRTLVLTASNGSQALLSRPVEPHPELAGRWLIESIGGSPMQTERRRPILTIRMGHIAASADCNSMGAPFSIPAPHRIAVAGPLVATQMGCMAEDAAEDALLAHAVGSLKAYRIQGGKLLFTGGPGMVLRRPPQPNRTLPGDFEACGNTLPGGYHVGPITLSIAADTMRDNAGCVARYSTDGPALTLRLAGGGACSGGASPFVPGEPVAVGGSISTLAVTRPDGFAFDEEGRLILRTGRGLLTMCRKGGEAPSAN